MRVESYIVPTFNPNGYGKFNNCSTLGHTSIPIIQGGGYRPWIRRFKANDYVYM